ncbi:Electron transport complex protein rnfA [Porphyromonas crevioricanis]|uniref:Ion-translocating oxidoreductase complex subunit A n=1 Tax=Porphyromonas crevioricanis TaxID=393921 RepID=A0A2X4SSK6_9PORP|nr:electron transport complex protein RnfA [Porphyromonas crevioricanis JCM 13913]SQH72781.1 Electron transport complex protein rnfA [Porphyromonas crevioricanis]
MEYLLIFIAAIFVNNVVLAQFLGICPFLGVSKKVQTSIGMGAAVTFVLTLATIVTFLIQKFVLDRYGLEFAQTIVFILIIAALVQMVEIILKKVSPSLYQALGVFLPLITTNCCVLGVAILVIQKDYSFMQSLIYAISTAIGFTLALVTFAGIREQLAKTALPKAMMGMPAAMLVAGILAMSFMGFSGMDKGIRRATSPKEEVAVVTATDSTAAQQVDAVAAATAAAETDSLNIAQEDSTLIKG